MMDDIQEGNGRAEEPAEATPAATYTIDALAAAAGVPTRTVRLYQSVGVLDRPQRRGRIAVYSEPHLHRLRRIAELQDHGLRLRAIRAALRHAARGHGSVESWLGLGDECRAPSTAAAPLLLPEAALRARLGERPPGFIAALRRARLVRQEGRGLPPTYLIPNPELLEVALKFHAAGIDIDTAAAAAGMVRKRLQRIADELAHTLRRRAKRSGGSGADADENLATVRAAANDAVHVLAAQAIEGALQTPMEGGRIAVRARRRR